MDNATTNRDADVDLLQLRALMIEAQRKGIAVDALSGTEKDILMAHFRPAHAAYLIDLVATGPRLIAGAAPASADNPSTAGATGLQYRKKPAVVEAFQFQQPTSVGDAPEWLTEAVMRGDFLVVDGVAHITTLEGIMPAQPGDWIIRGVKGEIYPCKPDIFAATYEPAAAPVAHSTAGAVEPERMNITESKEYLIKFMEQHFTDKTFHRYIRGGLDRATLAGDFAWQLARALRMILAAPVEQSTAGAAKGGITSEDSFGYLNIADGGKSLTTVSAKRFWKGDCKIPDGMYKIVSAEQSVAAPAAQVPAQMQWISVDERLPKCSMKAGSLGVEVIVYPQPDKGESTAFFGCRLTDEPDFYKYGSRVTGVTHWMPLPAAPEQSALRTASKDQQSALGEKGGE